tara:strand:+ start:364 stop:531 length:168 start_codon:yes stop_codon:yes gene_type:complete
MLEKGSWEEFSGQRSREEFLEKTENSSGEVFQKSVLEDGWKQTSCVERAWAPSPA